MDEVRQPVVIVVGAGYSGVLAANRLSGKLRGKAQVVLIAPEYSLLDRIRLHEVAVHGGDVRRSFHKVLAADVSHVRGRAVGLATQHNRIAVDRGAGAEWLPYDALVLALGSRLSPAIPSTAPHALALAGVEQAQQLAAALARLPAGRRVVIVGGGLSAIELSSEIAETYPELTVIMLAAAFVPDLAGPAREALRAGLEALGVQIREGVGVAELTAEGVRLEDGSWLDASISVLAAGFRGAALPDAFGLPARADGRVPVDSELRVAGARNVFVAGDLAAPPSEAIGSGLDTTRMACATALPLGAHAADQVVRLLSGRALEPYRFVYALRCISLGRKSGVLVSVDPDDRPTGNVRRGWSAALMKEIICRFVIGALRLERAIPGAFVWAKGRQPARQPAACETRPASESPSSMAE